MFINHLKLGKHLDTTPFCRFFGDIPRTGWMDAACSTAHLYQGSTVPQRKKPIKQTETGTELFFGIQHYSYRGQPR